MSTIIHLEYEWRVNAIPLYKSERDADDLRRRCLQRFRIKGNRRMIVVTGRGEILDGLTDVEQVISIYRLQGSVALVDFPEKPMLLLTQMVHSN